MLKAVGVRQAELSVVFLPGREMRALNRKYLGHDRVTDVISFNLSGTRDEGRRAIDERFPRSSSFVLSSFRPSSSSPACIDGEIYICPTEARRNARAYGEPLKRELLRYLAHGILHLLGFDDATVAERERMRELEDKLLSRLGTLDTGHKTQE
jgi:rRNA maturation RNase YbeY